ncbi:hypothetical protein [Ectothiorhodospira shaposhnikovii]|uniref:hypothetical protein n=1 Tax=Ectothiorhodospira shaposhnikovii TaxID=1054 RepID=UPI0039A2BE1F
MPGIRSPQWQRWLWTLLLGGLGAALNLFPMVSLHHPDLPLQLYPLPGLAAAFLVLILFGTRWALLATAIVALPTLLLWHTVLAILVLLLEMLVVAWLVHRRHLMLPVADIAFWGLLGLPLWWIVYQFDPRLDQLAAAVVLFKQALNGVAATTTAGLIVLVFKRDLMDIPAPMRQRVYSIRAVVFNLFVLMTLLPAVFFIFFHAYLLGDDMAWLRSTHDFLDYLLLSILLLLSGLMLAYWLSVVISRSLTQTAVAVQGLTEDQTVPRMATRLLEPDVLNQALVNLSLALREERHQVEMQSKRLQRLVFNAPIAIWCGRAQTDGAVKTTFANGRFEEFIGLNAIPDSTAFFERVHPVDADKLAGMFRAVHRRGYVKEELRFKDCNNRQVWLYMNISLKWTPSSRQKEYEFKQ